MSKLTITGCIDEDQRTRNRGRDAPAALAEDAATAPKDGAPPCRLARMLALAYLVDRLVEDGKLWDYAHAARVLGVSRARMTQIVNLACLPVREQEDVLLGRTSASERQMRAGDVA